MLSLGLLGSGSGFGFIGKWGQGLGLFGSGSVSGFGFIRKWNNAEFVFIRKRSMSGLGLLSEEDQCQGWGYCRKRINVSVGFIVGRRSVSGLGLFGRDQ